ncbi:family S53 protease-like protein [Trametes coccinea BRFM310]|uniref:tripeptidyl-peptidase II n=1 Tax=Trametes coccinea (strain BRFM310) TaxID=1353009 RepID=A0A1Y2IKZ0_TRAC3|nr:family S53 protease-like protein [Trametes coccinea BRFM310]
MVPHTKNARCTGLLFFAFLSAALARPTTYDDQPRMLVHERRSDVPNGFTYLGKADDNVVLNLRIALAQSDPVGLEAALYDVSTPGSKNYRKHRDPVGLEAALYDVSTPGSKNYRKHLSKVQVEAFATPKPESVQAVKTWLAKNNVTASTISPAGDWLSVQIPVAKANAMLATQFGEYTHAKTNVSMIRTLSYSLPETVKGHLAAIHPTTSFIEPRISPAAIEMVHLPRAGNPKAKTIQSSARASTSLDQRKPQPTLAAAVDDSCKTQITPECLQAIYNIPAAPASGRSNLFVATFAQESATPSDLKAFLGQFRQDVANHTSKVSLQSLDGGTNNNTSGTTEASLDLQYTTGVATNVPITVVTVGSDSHDGIAGFLDVVNNLLAQEQLPQVLTTSFGFTEKDIPAAIGSNLCNAYAQLGARGTTVLFASGDGGVSGIQATQDCTTFLPTFPSSCPFVTSVGGTTSFGPEVAVSFSSGGFSNLFARPKYQDTVINAYLKKLNKTNAGLFNSTGRAFPDIAAQAQGFQVVVNGQVKPVAGTSAASPTVASLVALLNDAIIKDGGAPVGFLNPFLYSQGASALNDITQGNNPGCGTNGFPATEGWDAVTGLGTPDFAKLLSALKKGSAVGSR